MENRVQIVAVIAAAALLVLILELVRRRRFLERYALLWMGSAALLLVLGLWSGALNLIADAVGISTPSNALFVIAFGFVLLLLLHFSLVVSSLADQSKVLAQRVALLQEELQRAADGPRALGRTSPSGSVPGPESPSIVPNAQASDPQGAPGTESA
jgi:hypothetical protein